MSCQWIDERLFDEDCREAIMERGSVPHDVVTHLEVCQECSRSWAHATRDMVALREVLAPALEGRQRRILEQIPSRAQNRKQHLDFRLVSIALSAGGLAAGLSGAGASVSFPWQLAVFSLVTAWAYVFAWTGRSGVGPGLLHVALPWRLISSLRFPWAGSSVWKTASP